MFEQFYGFNYPYAVRRFRNIWFALAALLWLPAYAHCQLEALTGLEVLQCVGAPEESHAPDSDCDDCGDCCAVEKSPFRASLSRFSVAPPVLIAVLPTVSPVVTQREAGSAWRVAATAPHLPRCWHFLSRTALPVRAPSLAS